MHQQITIKYNECLVDVDIGIADLMLEMLKADIRTLMSCENNNGKVWILVPHYEVEKFMSCLFGKEHNGVLYDKILGDNLEPEWTFSGVIEDYIDDDINLRMSIGIRFPISDYKEVVNRMRSYNARYTI